MTQRTKHRGKINALGLLVSRPLCSCCVRVFMNVDARHEETVSQPLAQEKRTTAVLSLTLCWRQAPPDQRFFFTISVLSGGASSRTCHGLTRKRTPPVSARAVTALTAESIVRPKIVLPWRSCSATWIGAACPAVESLERAGANPDARKSRYWPSKLETADVSAAAPEANRHPVGPRRKAYIAFRRISIAPTLSGTTSAMRVSRHSFASRCNADASAPCNAYTGSAFAIRTYTPLPSSAALPATRSSTRAPRASTRTDVPLSGVTPNWACIPRPSDTSSVCLAVSARPPNNDATAPESAR